MKKIMPIMILLLLAVLTGCDKNRNVSQTLCPPTGYGLSVNGNPAGPVNLVANGTALAQVNVTIPNNIGYSLTSPAVVLTITDGTLIFNSSAPTSRLELSYAQISQPYTLSVRSGINPDTNVVLTMQSQCSVVAQFKLHYITPAQVFTHTRWHVVIDSSKALTNPFVEMYLTTDSTLAGGNINLMAYLASTLTPVPGFNPGNPPAVMISPSGRTANFLIPYLGTSPDQNIAVIATLGGYEIDTTFAFYNLAGLLPSSAITAYPVGTSGPLISNGNSYDIHFSSGVPQLAGYPATFKVSEGVFVGATLPTSATIQTVNMDTTGGADVFYLPPTGFVGTAYFTVNYYSNFVYSFNIAVN